MGDAVVTHDVLHSGVIWGWFVTMNFWAKSVATGALLLAPWMIKYPRGRIVAAGVGFVFLNITLLFTVMDLHQPLRFWHMFVYPHFTSAIMLGAWLLTLYNLLLVLHFGLAFSGRNSTFDRLLPGTWVVAFLSTVYTAGLLGQSNAREIWQAPAEAAQMLLAATLAGSAVYLLLRVGTDNAAEWLISVLGMSAGISLIIYLFEVFIAPQKSAEAAHTIELLLNGPLQVLFVGGLMVGFAFPAAVAAVPLARRSLGAVLLASIAGLAGLWMVKHAWLIAPQLIPLS